MSEYPPTTVEGVREWLPEVTDIETDEVRGATIDALLDVPAYFWSAPAAKYHHPPDHRGRHGLVLHVKRVCTKFERMTDSMTMQGHLSDTDIDHGRAACLLHDCFKYGSPPTAVDSTVSNHDVIAAQWADTETSVPDGVVAAINQHMGPWGSGANPTSHLAQMVHIADLHASDENSGNIAIKEPNDILQQKFPTVPSR